MSPSIARLRRYAARTLGLGPQAWMDLATASLELAWASHQLRARAVRDLLLPRQSLDPRSVEAIRPLSLAQQQLVQRVALSVSRMGMRVPWRADCLVQALAAQRWLSRSGIATSLMIGVRGGENQEFAAHAWLRLGDQIVTGGEVSAYAAFDFLRCPPHASK